MADGPVQSAGWADQVGVAIYSDESDADEFSFKSWENTSFYDTRGSPGKRRTPDGTPSYDELVEQNKKLKERATKAEATIASLHSEISMARQREALSAVEREQLIIGLRPNAETATNNARYVEVDGQWIVCNADLRRLACAMAHASATFNERVVITKLLRLPESRDKTKPNGIAQRSPYDTFQKNELNLDMFGAVACHPEIFEKLWKYCVHPRCKAKDVLPRRGERQTPRSPSELGTIYNDRAYAPRAEMPWHDGRPGAPAMQADAVGPTVLQPTLSASEPTMSASSDQVSTGMTPSLAMVSLTPESPRKMTASRPPAPQDSDDEEPATPTESATSTE